MGEPEPGRDGDGLEGACLDPALPWKEVPVGHTNRYQITPTGQRHALFLTRAHNRLLCTSKEWKGLDEDPRGLLDIQRATSRVLESLAQSAERLGKRRTGQVQGP